MRYRLPCRTLYHKRFCDIKPIFHCDAKYLASGVGVGQCPSRQNFAWEKPTCWYILALPPTPIPEANPKMCVTPDANPRHQSVEYRWHWAFWHWGWCWACTFYVVYVNFICIGHPTQTRFSVEYGLKCFCEIMFGRFYHVTKFEVL